MATRWYIVDIKDANGRTGLVVTNITTMERLIQEVFDLTNTLQQPGTWVEVTSMIDEIFEMNDHSSYPLLIVEV